MFKNLNIAELYLYNELNNAKLSYGEAFLLNVCSKKNKNSLKKSSSFEDKSNPFFNEKYALNNSFNTTNTATGSSKNTGNNTGSGNNTDTGSSLSRKMHGYNNSCDSSDRSLSPDVGMSPLTPHIYQQVHNNITKKNINIYNNKSNNSNIPRKNKTDLTNNIPSNNKNSTIVYNTCRSKSDNSSPEIGNSPLTPNIKKKISKKKLYINKKMSISHEDLLCNTFELDDNTFICEELQNTEVNKKSLKHVRRDKNHIDRTVSLDKLNDEIYKYKFLYYTDNSYIIPKYISKLLEMIYGIKS